MERIGLAPGVEIGGYTVVAPLGAGGMGTVYRALDGGGNPVALKLLHTDSADDAARARLLREVAALQRLRHPAVAAVLDAETDSTEAFLVTELVDGTDLEELVRARGPLDADALLALATGLRDALAAVHAAGVVHRDLKPSNVLMTDDGPVLIDFGLAQGEQDTRLTSTGLVAGTPGYLAPELLDGDDPGESVDWWGWAALLAFAATGRPPFGRGRATTVLARARAGKPDLTGLGRLTRRALRGALAADPAERTAPDDVLAALTVVAAEGDRMPAPRRPRTEGPGSAADDEDGKAADDEAADGEDGAADDSSTALPGSAQAATAALLTGTKAGATALLTGADAVGTTALPAGDLAAGGPVPTAVVPAAHDGRTRMVRAAPPTADDDLDDNLGRDVDDDVDDLDDGSSWDDDPQYHAVDWIEDDLDASSGEPGTDTGYRRPAVPRRWVSQLVLAALVIASGARRPGLTLLVVIAFLLVARTYGSAVEAMHGRRERRGVRRSDGWVALATTPWHLLRAVVGMVPALLVAGSVLVISVGVAWWFVGRGSWTIGDNVPGQQLTGSTAAWLAGLVVLLGVLLVWFGPASRMTRVGTRRLLELVSPRRLGALVLVVLLLAVVAVVASGVLHGAPVVWRPLPVPTVPSP